MNASVVWLLAHTPPAARRLALLRQPAAGSRSGQPRAFAPGASRTPAVPLRAAGCGAASGRDRARRMHCG